MDIKLDSSDRKEILRYLGYRGSEITETVEKELAEAVDITNNCMEVRTVWKPFEIEKNTEGIAIPETGVMFLGEGLKKHLGNTCEAVLFCVTLGANFDRRVERELVTNPSRAVIMNAAGVAAVEKAADALQREMDTILAPRKTGVRFSPGYSDLPLETGADILRMLNAEKTTGIRMNESFLMNPMKSVTCIAGIY